MICSNCGFSNTPTAKYCQNCGFYLSPSGKAFAQEELDREQPLAHPLSERRQITVLFSDIIGSTDLSTHLDPEEMHDVLVQYQRATADAVSRRGGFVSQFVGDGVVAFFGFPEAHETDPELALLAGLDIVAAIETIDLKAQERFGVQVKVRVGIHTGLVMIESDQTESPSVYGETPNVAARVQTFASANKVLITSATHQLVHGYFEVEDAGFHKLRGLAEKIQLFRVLSRTAARDRLQRENLQDLTPFVGRRTERQLLATLGQKAFNGEGQLVLISGDAGIGKSRLVRQFRGELDASLQGVGWLETGCSEYKQNTPFAPIVELMQQAFGWTSETDVQRRYGDLAQGLDAVGFDLDETVPLLSNLLGLPPSENYRRPLISPEQQRARLIETLVDWLLRLAKEQPYMFLVEDLHWADPSTLAVLSLHAERSATAPVLYILTARPGFDRQWSDHPNQTMLVLHRLRRDQVHDMIERLAGSHEWSAAHEEVVAERTDGVPLYIEELTRAFLASGNGNGSGEEVPATLHDLLMARLDRLGSAKELAQIGSVLGREFSYPLIHEFSGLTDPNLLTQLSRLTNSGLMVAEGQPPELTYRFKHALVQDAAYNSLLKSKRSELHKQAAKTLKSRFGDIVESSPELLARHYAQAGETQDAIEAWIRAGESAADRAAYEEAIRNYNQALDLLQSLPEGPLRKQQELLIQVPLGRQYQATMGFGSAKATAPFDRAQRIARELGESPNFVYVLLGLWSSLTSRGEAQSSIKLANDILELAQREGEPLLQVWAHFALGIDTYILGRPAESWQHYKLLTEYYRDDDTYFGPFDPLVSLMIHGSLSLWHLGLADQALELHHNQINLAAEKSPGDQAMALLGGCNLYIYLREPERVQEYADRLKELVNEHGLTSFEPWTLIYQGISLVHKGNHEQGIAQMREGIGAYNTVGTRTSLGWYLALLADAYLRIGDCDRASQFVEVALEAVPDEQIHLQDVHFTQARIREYRAENEEMTPDERQELQLRAERSYRRALQLADQFGSLSYELRSATGLSKLWYSQGKSQEARELLEPIYSSISEGYETPDMLDARSLLDRL